MILVKTGKETLWKDRNRMSLLVTRSYRTKTY